MHEEPKYKVHFDKELAIKGASLGKNPYSGTVDNDYDL